MKLAIIAKKLCLLENLIYLFCAQKIMSDGLSHLVIPLTLLMIRTAQKAITKKKIGTGLISKSNQTKLYSLMPLKFSAVVNPRTNRFANMETKIPNDATNTICINRRFIKICYLLKINNYIAHTDLVRDIHNDCR